MTHRRHAPKGLYPLPSELRTKILYTSQPNELLDIYALYPRVRFYLSLAFLRHLSINISPFAQIQRAHNVNNFLSRVPHPIQTLWVAFKTKAPTVESPPPSLQHRFDGLLGDAAGALQSDLIPCPLAAALVAGRGVIETSGGGAGIDTNPDLTLANIEAIEGVFDTVIGVNVENDQVCRFVRTKTAV